MAEIVFVDVDDTLIRSVGSKRIPMTGPIAQVRRLYRCGALLYCWSTGGADYARASAREVGLEDCFQAFLPKPHALLDDTPFARWGVREIHPLQLAGGEGWPEPEAL